MNIQAKKIFITATVFTLALTGIAGASQAKRKSLMKQLPLEEQARWQIIEVLGSDDVLKRMNAIEAIGLSGDESLMANLIMTLNSDKSTEPEKFAALMSIGDARFKTAEKAVRKYENSEAASLDIASAYALIRLGDTSLERYKSILKHLDSEDQAARDNAVMALGKAGDRKYINLLRWIFNSEKYSERTKLLAIEATAELRDPEAFGKAWALMISKRADDRVMGIKFMRKLMTNDSRNSILTMLDDGVLEVRLVAAGQLALMGDKSGLGLIEDFFAKTLPSLEGEDRERALIHAIDAIIALKKVEVIKLLPGLMNEDSENVRLKAAQAILSV